jgi:hypothetical protein
MAFGSTGVREEESGKAATGAAAWAAPEKGEWFIGPIT